jgi:serine/threonine-protein kinase
MGVCPTCTALGPIGEPCPEKVCARQQRHFVPGDYAAGDPEALPDPLVGRRLGEYLVVDLLGRGSFGRVYLGLQLPLLMKVAVKLISLDSAPADLVEAIRARFVTEARALAALQHPNVVRLVHYGELGGWPYLVMDYVEGGRSLAAEIEARARRDERFALAELRELFRQLLDGLAAAHAAGIVHRDVKPENLMLQQVPGHPRLLRILDFGIAKFVQEGTTVAGMIGTPAYMAPEQFANRDIGPHSDLYAVGVVAFEVMLGRAPFPAATPAQRMAVRLDPRHDPLRLVADLALPVSVLGFFRRALARDIAERFATAAEMGAALELVLAEAEASPGHPLRSVRLGKLLESDGAPAPAARPVAGEASDEAFRRWLEAETRRLGDSGRRP